MNTHIKMISLVAEAMGDELLKEVAFVGGCTTGLLITDAFSKEQVRHTDDVDLIIHVVGQRGIYDFQEQLSKKGFKHDISDGAPICAMMLGELRVDFMPDESSSFGFTNKWYADALRTSVNYILPKGINIKLVRPDYFIATKFEAYKGRGNNDPLGSRDIEDILMLIDGRNEILEELNKSPDELIEYIRKEFSEIVNQYNFSYAVGSAASHDESRENEIFARIENIIRG